MVLFLRPEYSGKEVLINKEKHLLLNDEDVVAIVIGD
jgi:co-chaperonin GroES (HSP10)